MPDQLYPPSYRATADANVFDASFASGSTLRVRKSRARNYPGLNCPAPDTRPFYQAVAAQLKPRDIFWDVGCGAGIGLLEVGAAASVGFDADAEARSFAKQWASGSTLCQLHQAAALPRPSLVTVIDVLGHTEAPEALLRWLAQQAPHAAVLVAEPLATAGQTLLAPARRAFSAASLEAVLTRGGFRVEDWLLEGSFTACVARAAADDRARRFETAAALSGRGRCEQALPELLPLLSHTELAVRVEARLASAELCLQLRQGDAATAHYLSALDEDADASQAMAGLSQLLLTLGDVTQGAEWAARAFALDPLSVEAACARALALQHLSPAAASAAWAHAVDLEPSASDIVFTFAQAAMSEGHTEAAIEAMARLRAYGDPPAVDFHITLGWLLLEARRASEAKVEAQLAQLLDDEHPGLAELRRALSLAA